eukprot:gnl/TRDRNA2_/TRDRNA2_163056_c0_seq3.p1 gnl/TRDRNA2_/TRDRNA2_163056_c0~~gnl/TRDRNA2_/TRDRNA2_163056_c0_seq3.p1  ORF type:complete len:1033 (-),score=167.79 gnl/TRDRNA2_/TRDRNA2_163056_c0_seq3:140-3238(-)
MRAGAAMEDEQEQRKGAKRTASLDSGEIDQIEAKKQRTIVFPTVPEKATLRAKPVTREQVEEAFLGKSFQTQVLHALLAVLVVAMMETTRRSCLPTFEKYWRIMEKNCTVFQMTTFISPLVHLATSCVLNIWPVIVQHTPSFQQYKLQKNKAPASAGDWGRVIYWVFLSQLFVQFPLITGFSMLKFEHDFDSMPGPLDLSWRILIAFIIEDTWHYFVHRLGHDRRYYKYVHKVHHEYPNPFALEAEFAHPVETVVLGGGFFIPLVLFTNHLIFAWVWLVLRLAETTDVHLGYDIPFNPLKFIPGYAGVRHHDFHHAKFTCNYASTFMWWDRWLGTDKKFLDHERQERAAAAANITSLMEARGAQHYEKPSTTTASASTEVPYSSCLVTGSEGMVGSRLVSMLASRGVKRIVCLDVQDPVTSGFYARADALRKKYDVILEYARMDISSQHAMLTNERNPFADVDVVFHVAALVGPFHQHEKYTAVNVMGTGNVLEALRVYGGSHHNEKNNLVFVDCSSPSTRFDGGHIRAKMEDELPYCFNGHEYARTKALGEQLVLKANGAPGTRGTLATCAIAPHQVYGPEDQLFLPSMLETARNGKLRVFGEGDNMVSFTHVDNITHALILGANKLFVEGSESKAAADFFVVTDGPARSFWDVIDMAVTECGFASLYSRCHLSINLLTFIAYLGTIYTALSGKFVKLTPFTVRMLTIDRVFCISKAQSVLGYSPVVRFEDGWAETVKACKAQLFTKPSPTFAGPSTSNSPYLWQADSLSKRRGERFYLWWSAVWMSIMGFIVISGVYEKFDEWTYMTVGMVIGVPCVVLPLLFPALCDDVSLPWHRRYTTKCAAWIWIMSWVGNYFWTHYFYNLLGASYTFPAHRLNNVPFCLFLITHSYFVSYHTFSNFALRRLRRATDSRVLFGIVVALMSYAVAYMETWTIEEFPYYQHEDKAAMYKVGSVFYALYFVVSFPMFLRVDEDGGPDGCGASCWTLWQAIMESLASCMLVTQLLDFWRLYVGSIVSSAPAGGVIGAAAVQ